MGLRDYEAQWQSIMADNMFTEKALITDNESIAFEANGVFFSGSYDEESSAAYAPKRYVQKEYFKMSDMEIPAGIPEPWKTLNGLDLILIERGIEFRIRDVAGKRGGEFTLSLQEKKDV